MRRSVGKCEECEREKREIGKGEKNGDGKWREKKRDSKRVERER